MAKLIKDSRRKDGWRYEPKKNGIRFRFRFAWTPEEGSRDKEPLGIKVNIDRLIKCWALDQTPGEDLTKWVQFLADRNDPLFDQLKSNGLIEERKGHTVGTLCEEFIESKKLISSDGTIKALNQAVASAIEFFKEDRDITTITHGDAKAFRVFLETEPKVSKTDTETGEKKMVPYALATRSVRLKKVKSIFEYAFDHEHVNRNPFKGVAIKEVVNKDRQFFIDRELMAQVFDALPNAKWRLLFALYRIGGARFKEGVELLKWEHVLWDRNLIDLPDAKAAIHGRISRRIPIYDELRPYLDDVWELAKEGDIYIFPEWAKLGNPNQQLHNRFKAYLKRAGIPPWPKLFQNLRSSRVTELKRLKNAPGFTIQRVHGHSAEIEDRHYNQQLDSDLDQLRELSREQTEQFNREAAAAREKAREELARTVARTRQQGTQEGQQETAAKCSNNPEGNVHSCPSAVQAEKCPSSSSGIRTHSIPRSERRWSASCLPS